MSNYVNNFKKFLKQEEKKTLEMGANPSMGPVGSDQDLPGGATNTPPQTPDQSTQTPPAPSSPNVESNPNVISARKNLTVAIEARDRLVGEKEKELAAIRAENDKKVNDSTEALNNALAEAAKGQTV